MLKKIVFFSCLYLAAGPSYAQSVNINGKLADENKKPIEFAGVSIIRLPDSVQVRGTMTDTTGNFIFADLPKGRYFIKANFMGYKPYKSTPFIYNEQPVNLGILSMELEAARILNTITVIAQKPLIEQQIDKMVLNVENSILAEGNNALELLEKAPGISVDDEGNVSLKGKSGTTVLLNGKLTYLSGKELANLLKGTSSSSISKIEIIGNPSAKYDATGNAGIVNIVMKKNTATGFNGSVNLNGGSGRKERYGAGTSLNYRTDKVNYFGSYQYGFRGETEYLDFTRSFYDNGIIQKDADRISYQNTKTDEPLHTNNFRAGIDYYLNDKNIIGFLINGNTGKYTHDSKTSNLLIDNINKSTISDALSHNYDKQSWENISYNLNYSYKIDSLGKELSFDADYSANKFTSDLSLNTKYKNSNGDYEENPSFRKGYVPSVTDVYVVKLDYAHPFNTISKLELGAKSSFVQADNNLRYDTLQNNQWILDKGSSNHFRYKEQIHSGYLSFSSEIKDVSIQAGLRGEFTNTKGHQITSDSLVSRNYFQLFPSLFITKPFGESNKVQFAYSRRIERPSYDELNPFRVFRDPFLFYEGNPFLRPELTQSYQLSHSFKSKYITVISYSKTKDVMNWIPGQIDQSNTTFSTPKNLSSYINYGISFTASHDLNRWWTGNHFVNVYHNKYEGDHQIGEFNNSITSLSFNTQNSFRIIKGLSAELSAYYHSKSVYSISTQKGYLDMATGIQKSVLKDKGNIKLLVKDVLNTKSFKRTTQYENINMYTYINVDTRVAMLSFSYRFGNQNIKKRERTTGSEDVQGRVKGG